MSTSEFQAGPLSRELSVSPLNSRACTWTFRAHSCAWAGVGFVSFSSDLKQSKVIYLTLTAEGWVVLTVIFDVDISGLTRVPETANAIACICSVGLALCTTQGALGALNDFRQAYTFVKSLDGEKTASKCKLQQNCVFVATRDCAAALIESKEVGFRKSCTKLWVSLQRLKRICQWSWQKIMSEKGSGLRSF